MKQIVFRGKIPPSIIVSDELTGNENIAYRCQNSDAVCVLAQLKSITYSTEKENWGFVSLNCISEPRYTGRTFKEAVEKAGEQRKLYVFENLADLIAISNPKK